MEALDALAETREAGERRSPRFGHDAAALVDAGAHAQRFAPGIEAEDLIALDAPDLETETVRAHVDDGEGLGGGNRTLHGDRA